MLELLREEQGEGQVAKKQDGQDQRNYCDDVNLHWRLPQLLAGLDVKKGQYEENNCEQQHRSILQERLHSWVSQFGRPIGRACSRAIVAHDKFEYRQGFLNKV
jgi:hypothetical protein